MSSASRLTLRFYEDRQLDQSAKNILDGLDTGLSKQEFIISAINYYSNALQNKNENSEILSGIEDILKEIRSMKNSGSFVKTELDVSGGEQKKEEKPTINKRALDFLQTL